MYNYVFDIKGVMINLFDCFSNIFKIRLVGYYFGKLLEFSFE